MKRVCFILGFAYLISACQQEKEVYYFSNGNVNQEYSVRDGKRHGKATSYFENGELQSVGYFEFGIPHGAFTYYYVNGNKKIEGVFKNGKKFDRLFFYREDGSLSLIEFYNDDGQLFDLEVFKENGHRDTSFESKRVLFISEKDTINLGEDFIAEIRLGNRQYNSTKIIIGDPNDKNILLYEFLPRKDSLTSIFKIKATKKGSNLIEGVALDLLVNEVGDIDSVMVVPFGNTFFVK